MSWLLGVMAPGEYEFGTSTTEYMTVVSGMTTILLPGETEMEGLQTLRNLYCCERQKIQTENQDRQRLRLSLQIIFLMYRILSPFEGGPGDVLYLNILFGQSVRNKGVFNSFCF